MNDLKEPTIVLFRVWKDGSGVTALFPYEIHSGYLCTCYAHVGQHSGADYQNVMKQTYGAQPAEYADLLEELTTLSPEPYVLKIIKRANWSKYRDAVNAAR